MRWLVLLVLSLAITGCSTKRDITFTALPADADLTIDGVKVGKGPVTQEIVFKGKDDAHTFSASRKGFKDDTVKLLRDEEKTAYQIALKPQTKKITLGVAPVPGIITVDGKPLSSEYTRQITQDLEFRVDSKDRWIPLKIRAERPNFAPAEITVNFEDQGSQRTLTMEALKKDVTIQSNPPGADIWIDGEALGKAPATATGKTFPFDITSSLFQPRTIKAQKPGYDPVEKNIGWDDGKTDYTIDLVAKHKSIRLVTEPANCTVEMDGTKIPVDAAGVSNIPLEFAPINEQGELKTHKITVTKKTSDSEWYPQTITIPWENGKQDYSVVLKEILSRPLAETYWEPTRTDDGWVIVPKSRQVMSFKDITEGRGRTSPQQLTPKSGGSQIDSLAISPDGASLLYTVLIVGVDKDDFRSQLMLIKTDGSAGRTQVTDGKTLDLTPAFTPDGQSIVFSSNRAGKRLSVWQMSTIGNPGKTQLTAGDTNDLWPNIDADPKPRLFYQTLVGPDPKLFWCPVGTTLRTEMTDGTQPRVSPRADSLCFAMVNQRTGKRDIFTMTDGGQKIQNITNTPDFDECNPSWNKDGSIIAYASDRGTDADKNHNYDIWTQDTRSETPVQVTTNGSHDDHPIWDNNNNIYFRSNRGGEWNVWKIATK